MIPLIISIWPYLAILFLAFIFAASPIPGDLLASLRTGVQVDKSPVFDLVKAPGTTIQIQDEEELAFAEDIAPFQALMLLRDRLSRTKLDEEEVDELINPIAPLLFQPTRPQPSPA
jgi:hypothetical protein